MIMRDDEFKEIVLNRLSHIRLFVGFGLLFFFLTTMFGVVIYTRLQHMQLAPPTNYIVETNKHHQPRQIDVNSNIPTVSDPAILASDPVIEFPQQNVNHLLQGIPEKYKPTALDIPGARRFLTPTERIEGPDRVFKTFAEASDALKYKIGEGCIRFIMPTFQNATRTHLFESAPPEQCKAVWGRTVGQNTVLFAKVSTKGFDYAYTVTIDPENHVTDAFIEQWY